MCTDLSQKHVLKLHLKIKNRKCFINSFYKNFATNRTNTPDYTLLFGAQTPAKINKTEKSRLTKLTCWLAAGCACEVLTVSDSNGLIDM